MTDFTSIRQPAVQGQFYPGRPDVLVNTVRDLVNVAEAEPGGCVRALIAPHAGYQFSGDSAGQGYALLADQKERIRRVVLMGLSHRVPLRKASVGDFRVYRMPGGDVPVDAEICQRLLTANRLFSDASEPHLQEHSLEVQLPFLQEVLGDFQLVPLVFHALERDAIRSVAATLCEALWREDTLWVVSSDFTHYGLSFGYVPFTERVPERIDELDRGAISYVEKGDMDGFLDYVAETGATICGHIPIAVLLAALEHEGGGCRGRLVDYRTSGRMTGDYSHTVSYATIAFVDETVEPATDAGSETAEDGGEYLTSREKTTLLRSARGAIEREFGKAKDDAVSPPEDELTETLKRDGAAFVTLHAGDNLRGCIGSIEAEEPLYRNVMRHARNAAFNDPRFMPLTEEEWPRVNLEISVLTPPRKIRDPGKIVVGRHGIILEKGRARAVFLPQVAAEQGWDRETTLSHLAMKAGLGPDDWRRGATFYVFGAVVFGDGDGDGEDAG